MRERITRKISMEAMDILSSEKDIEILGDGRYMVPSQTQDGKMYTTVVGKEAQSCDCPRSRKGTVRCKHIVAAQMLEKMGEFVAAIGIAGAGGADPKPEKRTELSEDLPIRCTECLEEEFVKWGRRGTKRKDYVQTYKCKKCGTRFSAEPETHRLAVSAKVLAHVVGSYFDGMSYKEVSDHMRRDGVDISPSTVANYVSRVVDACLEYIQTLDPDISDTWSVDGLRIKVKKTLKRYFYCIMDHRSRLMLALREFKTKKAMGLKEMFRDAKELAGEIPKILLADAEASIAKAARETLRQTRDGVVTSTFINAGAHIRGERTNNRQERVERTVAGWARRFGFVGIAANNRTRGMMIQYNFARTHDALGQTPAAAAGLIVHGSNPWRTLYMHAAWSRIERGVREARKAGKQGRKKSAKKCDKITRWITGRAVECVS